MMVLSGLVCLWSGHKMVAPKKCCTAKEETEEVSAGAAKEAEKESAAE